MKQANHRTLTEAEAIDRENAIGMGILGALMVTFPFWGKILCALYLGFPVSQIVW